MSLADYGAQQWGGVMFGVATAPATWYAALLTDEPGTGWDGSVLTTVEPADVAYARQPLNYSTDFTLADGGYVINAVELAYPTPVLPWGSITHWALADDPVAGQLWSFGRFLEPVDVPAGYPVVLGIGSIYHALGNQLMSIAE